jgi:uncharacterized OB-fold protein
MEENRRPMPEPDEDSHVFWEGIKGHRIMAQKCAACGSLRSYPREICPSCLSGEFRWIECSGRGHIYSYTTVYRPPLGSFSKMVPYTIALVDLEEGTRLLAHVEGDLNSIAVGTPVEAVFEDLQGKGSLPKFRVCQ